MGIAAVGFCMASAAAETTTLTTQVLIIIPERRAAPEPTTTADASAAPRRDEATPSLEHVVVTERFDGTTRSLLYTYVEPN